MTIKELMIESHQTAVEKGFWTDQIYEIGKPNIVVAEQPKNRNDGELIALMHSELSEALEALRHNNPPSEHVPEFTSVEEEMADLAIRLGDFCEARAIRLEEAIKAKMKFNKTRPYKHDKHF